MRGLSSAGWENSERLVAIPELAQVRAQVDLKADTRLCPFPRQHLPFGRRPICCHSGEVSRL